MLKQLLLVPFRRMSQVNRLCCCIENEDNLKFNERDSYVGIQETVGAHPKLNALIKHRYTHFHVNEIGLDGKIIHLTDLDLPSQPVDLTPDEPFYVHCTLYKERFSHPEVLDYLVGKLRIGMDDIGYAGIKDKWGCTTQKISIRNIDPQRLVALNATNRHVKLGNFTYEKHPIVERDLIGNHFRIMLVNVNRTNGDASSISDDIDTAVKSLKSFGFVNYFGIQRFGFGHRSQIIGKTMVQMKWEEVFDLVLRPRQWDPDFIQEAKNFWFSDRDPVKILENLPADYVNCNKKPMEIWLLEGLAKHYDGGKGDLIKAFKTIPEYFRLLNYAAIKSFLWNHLVSYRIRTFGLKPIPGDIVSLRSAARGDENIESISMEIERLGPRLLEHEIAVLTESDFDSNGNCRNYSIYDVVLDMPGSKMTAYANPKVQSYFEMLLQINQLEVDSFAKFVDKFGDHMAPEVSCRSFRHIVRRPINLTYKLVPYTQKDLRHLDRIIPSELDGLRIDQSHSHKVKKKKKKNGASKAECKDHDQVGVLLEFSLLTGTYATIALRELLNCTRVWK